MTFMIDEPKIMAWKDLQFTKDFCDVTLACDNKQIEAHRAVLSSTSHLFRNILKDNSTKFPFINLVGIQYSELANMLHFMYQGQVNIDHNDLHSFLAIAEDFKIKGIFEGSKSSYNYVNLQLRYPYSNHSSKSKPTADLLHKEIICDKNMDTFQNILPIDQQEDIDNINLEIKEDILSQAPKKKVNFETFNNKELNKDNKFNKRDVIDRKSNGLFSTKNKCDISENSNLHFANYKKYDNEFNQGNGIYRLIQNNSTPENTLKQLFEKEGAKQVRIKASTVHQEFTRHRVKVFRKRWGKERLITISKCNHCNKEYAGKNPSTLKAHLEGQHSQPYEEVIKKDVSAFNKINGMESFERKAAKRIRVKASSVHQEFTRHYVETFKKGWGKETLSIISKCNHCTREYIGKNPTTLKVHLEVQHYQIYEEVIKKDVSARQIQKFFLENSLHEESRNSEKVSIFKNLASIDQLEDTDILNQRSNNNDFNKDLKKEMYKDEHLNDEEFNEEYAKESKMEGSLTTKMKENLCKSDYSFYGKDINTDENLKNDLFNEEGAIELEKQNEDKLSKTNNESITEKFDMFDLRDINMDKTFNADSKVIGLDKHDDIISRKFTSKAMGNLNYQQGAQIHFSQNENNSIAKDNALEKFGKEGAKQTRVKASAVHKEFTRRQVNSLKTSLGKEMFSTISKCNHCDKEYQGKNPTTLKTHLEVQHNDIFEEVLRKDTEQRQKLFWENRK